MANQKNPKFDLTDEKSIKSFKQWVSEKFKGAELAEDLLTVNVKAAARFSNQGKKTREDYQPSAKDLSLINQNFSNIDLTAEDLLVFTLTSADMKIDRQFEHFAEKALKSAAKMSMDKAFLIDHDWEISSQVGKIFSAGVEDSELKQKIYMLNDPMNDRVIKNILAGIHNKVSVGFSASMSDMVCDSCNDGTSIFDYDECPHYPGQMDDKGKMVTVTIQDIKDYYEVSLVAVPAQRDAGIRRDGKSQLEASTKSITAALISATESEGIKLSPEQVQLLAEQISGAVLTQKPAELENPELVSAEVSELSETPADVDSKNTASEIVSTINFVPDKIELSNTDNPSGELLVPAPTTPDSELDKGKEQEAQTPEVPVADAVETPAETPVVEAPAEETPVVAEETAPEAAPVEEKTITAEEISAAVKSAVAEAMAQLTETISGLVQDVKALAEKAPLEALASDNSKIEALDAGQKDLAEKLGVLAEFVKFASGQTLDTLQRDSQPIEAKSAPAEDPNLSVVTKLQALSGGQ